MKGVKYRYDEKKLAKSSALKKRIALLLATDYVRTNRPDIAEIMAFGLKDRPFSAYSEKALLKAFDELYMKKLSNLEKAKEGLEAQLAINGSSWHFEQIVKEHQKAVDDLQPYIDELIEEAFSE